ncbi:hypothetical protein IFVP5_C190249 [Vibrio parahaemolyticus]
MVPFNSLYFSKPYFVVGLSRKNNKLLELNGLDTIFIFEGSLQCHKSLFLRRVLSSLKKQFELRS